jgi:hypothetical protein
VHLAWLVRSLVATPPNTCEKMLKMAEDHYSVAWLSAVI